MGRLRIRGSHSLTMFYNIDPGKNFVLIWPLEAPSHKCFRWRRVFVAARRHGLERVTPTCFGWTKHCRPCSRRTRRWPSRSAPRCRPRPRATCRTGAGFEPWTDSFERRGWWSRPLRSRHRSKWWSRKLRRFRSSWSKRCEGMICWNVNQGKKTCRSFILSAECNSKLHLSRISLCFRFGPRFIKPILSTSSDPKYDTLLCLSKIQTPAKWSWSSQRVSHPPLDVFGVRNELEVFNKLGRTLFSN